MAGDLVALFTRIALVALGALALLGTKERHRYPGFVESAPDADALGLAHGMCLLPLPLL